MAMIDQAYIAGNAEVAPFFSGSPKALFASSKPESAWRPDMREAMLVLQERLGLEHTLAGNECVIATGQQPGLFTGPLFTIYKAITAIRVAELFKERTGRPCVPLFWIGGDDHDFEEARTAHVLTRDYAQLSLRYAPEDPEDLGLTVDGFPMHRVPVSQSLHGFIDAAAQAAPGSEYTDEIRSFLHQSLDCAISLADWFAVILAALFQDTPLLFFMPHVLVARRAASRILAQEIAHPLESTRLLNETGQRLSALGYAPQVIKHPNECNFFLEMGDRRRKVLFERERFTVPEENLSCTREEMLLLLELVPHRFSPNVALRCVVQQALFPVAAYVAGPGEIAYWAQLKPLFEFFGQPMPVVYPRVSAVLTTSKLKQWMTRFGLSYADLFRPEEELQEQALRATMNNPALDAYRTHQDAAETAQRDLAGAIAAATKDRGIQDMAAQWAEHSRAGMERMERVLLQADRAQADAVRKQVSRLCTSFAPSRKPQERVYSIVSFLFAHGPELIPRLLDALDVESFQMNEVEL